ncbi:MAG: tetratricopeptide repeat protein [Deltaproteobacteria bacterium]|nr:tetratricopeptide repeat protein [Deltaproteobacteria bacterium]
MDTLAWLPFVWTQFKVIVFYMGLFIYPLNLNLDHDFALTTHFFEWQTLFSSVFILGLLCLIWGVRKKEKILCFGLFWFFLALSIRNSIIPNVDFVADRALYVASIGLLIGLGWFIQKISLKPVFVLSALTFYIVYLGILTTQRAQMYQEDIQIWKDSVQKSPFKPRPRSHLAFAYEKAGYVEKAKEEYEFLARAYPPYANAKINLSRFYFKEGKVNEAIVLCLDAIKLNPSDSSAYHNLAFYYLNQRKFQKAWDITLSWIKIAPEDAFIYFVRGMIHVAHKRCEAAIEDFKKALVYNPSHQPSRFYLRQCLSQLRPAEVK